MTPPLFSGTLVPTTTGVTSLGMETVTFHLHAAQAGASSIQLSVEYETQRGCVGERPVFFFRVTDSPEFPVAVGAGAMHRVAGHLSSDLFCMSNAGGVAVTLRPTSRSTLTAADGTFAFDGVADGDYVLQIAPGNYEVPVMVAAQDVQIEFCIGCANALAISPLRGPVGTVVTARGTCYSLHSGRLVTIFFDEAVVAETRGDTPGSFSTTFTVPLDAAVGSHLVRLFGPGPGEIAAALFIVGSGAALCPGDCDGDRMVTVDELIRGVAMALGMPGESCPAFAGDGGVVSITDLIAAVDRALNGCDSP